jgi:hypothetical protein
VSSSRVCRSSLTFAGALAYGYNPFEHGDSKVPTDAHLRLARPLSDPRRVLFQSPIAEVGIFRCPMDHPRFRDSGPTAGYRFVFPRNAVWIEHEGSSPFVADATVVPLYNAGHPSSVGRSITKEIAPIGSR